MAGYRRGIRLRGAVVVVCGGAGAVGRATARALTGRGARPVLLDLPGPELDEAAREIGAPAFGVDVTDAAAVGDAARRAAGRWGRLDGWVQCAGGTAAGSLLDLAPGQVRRVLEVDVLGAVNGARAAVPHLAADGGGVLVLVVSVHGQVALPFGAPRSMAAAAVRAMAGALRQELRLRGVRGVAVTTVLAPDTWPSGSPPRVAATVLRRLGRPALETVGGGPVAKAVVHGHALVPPLTEWLVARRADLRHGG